MRDSGPICSDSVVNALALLGIAQREIKAQRCPDQGITRDRKGKSRVPKSLGDWVRLWRLNKGLTQRQLARIARLPCRRIHVIETDLVVATKNEIGAIERAMGIDATIGTARAQQ